MKTISKALAAALALIMALTVFTACGEQGDKPGGDSGKIDLSEYTPADSPVVTDEVRSLVSKASDAISGRDYIPAAYSGYKKGGGTDHLVLCIVNSDDEISGQYLLVNIHEDSDGGAKLTKSMGCERDVAISGDGTAMFSGGFRLPDTPEVPDNVKESLLKANEEIAGADYEPLACVGEQIVSGMNYRLLCKVVSASSAASLRYAIVTLYVNVKGEAHIIETAVFTSVNQQ